MYQLNIQGNPGLHRFRFTSLCDWSRELASLSLPIRRKTKANHNLVARVFPRLRQFGCCRFPALTAVWLFSLVLKGISLSSKWPL